jgi:subtilisin family serine protease
LDWTNASSGKGVVVAVIDSGSKCRPSSRAVKAFYDFTNGKSAGVASDEYGHGTHVAGTIAGRRAVEKNEYRGLAPASISWF